MLSPPCLAFLPLHFPVLLLFKAAAPPPCLHSRWTQPTLTQVLSSCAVLRGVPDAGLDWLRTAGDLRPFPRGADLTGLIAGGGVFIVVLGTVRVSVAMAVLGRCWRVENWGWGLEVWRAVCRHRQGQRQPAAALCM